MEVDRPAERARFGDHPDINSVALSPDGRWVAAGSRLGSEIKVWDRATGQLLAQLPDSTAGAANACVAFSPDGRWLVTGAGRVSVLAGGFLAARADNPSRPAGGDAGADRVLPGRSDDGHHAITAELCN